MNALNLGRPAPLFAAATSTRPDYALGSVAGRYVVLGFLPEDDTRRGAALAALAEHRRLFDDAHAMAFPIARSPRAIAEAPADEVGLRWFRDADGAISRRYGATDAEGKEHGCSWVVLDPSMRILLVSPIEDFAQVAAALRGAPAPGDHAGVPLHAPVLIVPRILEPELCRKLIDYYEAEGGQPSGVMREVDGKTIGVLDDFKRRSDAFIRDEDLQAALRRRIELRLLPEIEKAFQFKATRLERYIVASYEARDGGYFRPHRDNTTAGTAHRKFAVSINLNAEEFEGGDLRFAEFGPRTYRPPTGGAVVFSCSLLHEARPVTRGRRYAFLPFLYDEAGHAVRERNHHLVEGEPLAQAKAS